MHATTLLHNALPPAEREPLPAVPVEGVCCFTGETGPCVPRRELLGKSFTDQHLLRAPDSPLVGVPAWTALSHKWERMSSWWCDGREFRRLDRQGVRALVVGGVECAVPWAGYVTTSYKKHGALRAPVNSGGQQRWLFEMLLVDATDRQKVAEWWRVMNEALRDGIGRTSIETLDMPAGVIRHVGILRWEAYRAWARERWQSPLYRLLAYCLPSVEERKAAEKEAAACTQTCA